jgi:hypothetical protein
MTMAFPYIRTTIVATLAASLSLLTACGDQKRSVAPVQSRAERIQQVARQWSRPDSDKVPAGRPRADTPREAIASRIIRTEDLLPLGARRTLVEKLLGPPRTATNRRWLYVASRRPAADGFGGWCERRFEVLFDKHGRVTQTSLLQPTCPRDNNP